MDTDENGVTNGVKVSMFDISDPSDVKEVSKYTLDQYYYSDAFYDYRAALVDPEKNLIGFPLSGSADQYVILSYDKDQCFQVQMQEEVNGNSYLGTRGVYANEKFYVINGNAIEAYRMGDYVKIDDLSAIVRLCRRSCRSAYFCTPFHIIVYTKIVYTKTGAHWDISLRYTYVDTCFYIFIYLLFHTVKSSRYIPGMHQSRLI